MHSTAEHGHFWLRQWIHWLRYISMPINEHVCAFFFLTFTLRLLDKLWSQVSSLLPPGTCLQFLSRIGFSIPTARRLSSNVANSRFRAFRESICAQEKVPTNLYEYALGGTRTLCTSCINYSVYTCGRQLLRAYTYWSTAWVDIGQNDQIVLYLCAFCSQPHFIITSAAYKWSRQWTRLGQ